MVDAKLMSMSPAKTNARILVEFEVFKSELSFLSDFDVRPPSIRRWKMAGIKNEKKSGTEWFPVSMCIIVVIRSYVNTIF